MKMQLRPLDKAKMSYCGPLGSRLRTFVSSAFICCSRILSWITFNYLTVKGVPFWDKTLRLFYILWSHFLWPVNWFIITIGLTLPTLLNPAFGRTTLGYTVPKISSFVLTIALAFLVVMLFLDYIYRPKRPEKFPAWRVILMPFEFILMPVTGFIFGALPGIDAHTRLMLGKYIEYKVTEKV